MNTKCWLKDIPDEKNIRELTIPGTHDSGADLFRPFSRCQKLSLSEQLDLGVRFFDIRCRHINNGFNIHHGPFHFKKNFDDVANACRAFLKSNPSEFIIMSVNSEFTPKNNTRDFEETLKEYTGKNSGIFYLERELPTVGEARGKVVLFSRYGGNTMGIDVSDWPDNSIFKNDNMIAVQDVYKVPNSQKDKFGDVKKQLEAASSDTGDGYLYLNFCSGTNMRGMNAPLNLSKKTNAKLYEYIKNQNGKRYGIVILDFPETPHTDLTEKLIKLNRDAYEN